MIDPFVVLTPILVLAVMALLWFIGCDRVLGLQSLGPDAPTFSPGAGTYFSLPQGVTISADSGDKIYYTIDGSPPTTTSTPYSGPITLPTGRTTLNAIAVNSGNSSSAATAIYYIGPVTWVQKVETAGQGASMTPPFPALSQHNMIIVWIFYESTTVQVASVSDGQNTYTRACPPTVLPTATPFSQEIWFAFNIQSGANVQVNVTFTTGPAPVQVQISAHEYSNAYQENDRSLGPLAEMPPPGVSATGANAATSSVISIGRLVFGAAIFQGNGTPGAGFTSRSTLLGNVAEDMNITAPDTTVAAIFVNTPPNDVWVAQMITLL